MRIEEFLKKCGGIDPNEKISTNNDSWWKLKDLIKAYIEEEGLVKKSNDIQPVINTPIPCPHCGKHSCYGGCL